MKTSPLIILISCVFIFNACLNAQKENKPSSDIILIASTPADSFIKSVFNINQTTVVDFIRWDLRLKTGDNTFDLNINYGESQPNTLGFIKNGAKQAIQGTFAVSKKEKSGLLGDVYVLTSAQNQMPLSFVKLTDNLFHLITPDHKLKVGNGGWSYTMNRTTPLVKAISALPNVTPSVSLLKNNRLRDTFDGRTPCLDFAAQYLSNVSQECFKLKWRLILFRDSITFLPTTYTLNRTLHRSSAIVGKWSVVKGYGNNPDAVLYQLDPDKQTESLFFLVGDDNVLFFVDRKQQLFIGDSNFSYTLNRKLTD